MVQQPLVPLNPEEARYLELRPVFESFRQALQDTGPDTPHKTNKINDVDPIDGELNRGMRLCICFLGPLPDPLQLPRFPEPFLGGLHRHAISPRLH